MTLLAGAVAPAEVVMAAELVLSENIQRFSFKKIQVLGKNPGSE